MFFDILEISGLNIVVDLQGKILSGGSTIFFEKNTTFKRANSLKVNYFFRSSNG